MSTTLTQELYNIPLVLGLLAVVTGLALQWRRMIRRRSEGDRSKLRSTPLEAIFVVVGVALIVLSIYLNTRFVY